ncbi:MAG: glycosyltransferase family 2 protein [Hydrococcus sp. CRU_1_1]|nr:glycosyltransferase family 2 protein [Hydrococcus sp. CRU_1_1]NJQ97441.1 glycosyltransferase family 2 protein [Hydrococcus sp. CSU_1_8]
MSNKQPRVSIGLPVYNGEPFIKEAIESILVQTFKDFELIISDNASSDRTQEICQAYAVKDGRIRYYRNEENLGAARNFNRVFELSRGEYFKWQPADETAEPEFLARCVDLLDREPTLVLACTQFMMRDELKGTTQFLKGATADYEIGSPSTYARFRKLFVVLGHNGAIWGLMRSQLLKETHLIRHFPGADDCFLVELILKGGFGQIPEYLYTMRTHSQAYHRIKDRQNGLEGLEEAHWFDPTKLHIWVLPYWRRLWEFFLLIVRSREDIGTKLATIGFLYFVAVPKHRRWRKMLSGELLFTVRQLFKQRKQQII